jgi:hypothetical protein
MPVSTLELFDPVVGTSLETLQPRSIGELPCIDEMSGGFTCDCFFISILYALHFTFVVLLNYGIYFIVGCVSSSYYLCVG